MPQLCVCHMCDEIGAIEGGQPTPKERAGRHEWQARGKAVPQRASTRHRHFGNESVYVEGGGLEAAVQKAKRVIGPL